MSPRCQCWLTSVCFVMTHRDESISKIRWWSSSGASSRTTSYWTVSGWRLGTPTGGTPLHRCLYRTVITSFRWFQARPPRLPRTSTVTPFYPQAPVVTDILSVTKVGSHEISFRSIHFRQTSVCVFFILICRIVTRMSQNQFYY